jgi:hypothetical protein
MGDSMSKLTACLLVVLTAGCATSTTKDQFAGSCPNAGVVKHEEPQLVTAARTNNTDKLKALIASGVDINSANMYCESALLWAALNGHSETAELLLNKGADVNIKDDIGRTPLMMASAYGHASIVEILLGKGADVNSHIDKYVFAVWSKNETDLIEVMFERDHRSYERPLYDSGVSRFLNPYTGGWAISNRRIIVHGDTALVFAARFGYSSIAQSLLDKGASVNTKGKNGESPLVWASRKGHTEVVKILVARGADLKDRDNPMQLAVSDGHVTTVKVLLDAGADVESVRRITLIVPPYRLTVGNSVLLNASQKGHSEIVKLLLSKGADANAISWPSDNNPITDWGKTALMMAAEAGHTTVVRALLAANADVNQQRWYQDKRQSRTYLIRQGDGRTALMYAAVKGNTEIIEDLLRSGARINTADIGGDTALQLAREEGHKTVVQLLKKRGAE